MLPQATWPGSGRARGPCPIPAVARCPAGLPTAQGCPRPLALEDSGLRACLVPGICAGALSLSDPSGRESGVVPCCPLSVLGHLSSVEGDAARRRGAPPTAWGFPRPGSSVTAWPTSGGVPCPKPTSACPTLEFSRPQSHSTFQKSAQSQPASRPASPCNTPCACHPGAPLNSSAACRAGLGTRGLLRDGQSAASEREGTGQSCQACRATGSSGPGSQPPSDVRPCHAHCPQLLGPFLSPGLVGQGQAPEGGGPHSAGKAVEGAGRRCLSLPTACAAPRRPLASPTPPQAEPAGVRELWATEVGLLREVTFLQPWGTGTRQAADSGLPGAPLGVQVWALEAQQALSHPAVPMGWAHSGHEARASCTWLRFNLPRDPVGDTAVSPCPG